MLLKREFLCPQKGVDLALGEEKACCRFLDLEANCIPALFRFSCCQINFGTAEKKVHRDHALLQQDIKLRDIRIPGVLDLVETELFLPLFSQTGVNLDPEGFMVLLKKALMQSLKPPHGDIRYLLVHILGNLAVFFDFQQVVRVIHVEAKALGIRGFAVQGIPI